MSTELVGAARSGALTAAVCFVVFFTSHSRFGLSLEYICHILVFSGVGKYSLPVLL